MIRHRIVMVLATIAALAVPVLAKASPAGLSVRQSSAGGTPPDHRLTACTAGARVPDL
jgi:hypothetical protein